MNELDSECEGVFFLAMKQHFSDSGVPPVSVMGGLFKDRVLLSRSGMGSGILHFQQVPR